MNHIRIPDWQSKRRRFVSLILHSKMLGHSSLITTQHYARVLDSKISKDMEVLRASHLRIA